MQVPRWPACMIRCCAPCETRPVTGGRLTAGPSVKKFLKEVTLVNQPFVKDDKKSVADLLKAADAKIASYVLYVVGEGIEKRVDDFAAEVAAQQAAAAKA